MLQISAKFDENEAIIPHVDFKFDVAKGADWETTLNAMVDRVLDLTDGIIICVSSIDRNANVFDKIAVVVNAILPLGSLLSNCAGNGLAVDFENIINNIVFDEVLAGNFDNFLRLFETAEKTEDVANGVSVTYALIKASDHIVDAIFPNTVEAELYTESLTVQQEFTGSLSDQGIAARNMVSINSVKAELVPAVLRLFRESGILPSLVKSDCEHTNTVAIAAIPATCITTGYTEGTRCKDCGKWLTGHEEIAKDSTVHAGPVVEVEAVEATCTAAGTTAGLKCAACGGIISGVENVEALGHDYVAGTPVAPTCTEDGRTDGTKCSVCGTVIDAGEVIPAKGHTDADGDNACDDCGATIKKLSFIDKIKAFFQKIINWFKNLFKK